MTTRANMIRKNLWDSIYKTVALYNKMLSFIMEDAMGRARDCLLISELLTSLIKCNNYFLHGSK